MERSQVAGQTPLRSRLCRHVTNHPSVRGVKPEPPGHPWFVGQEFRQAGRVARLTQLGVGRGAGVGGGSWT